MKLAGPAPILLLTAALGGCTMVGYPAPGPPPAIPTEGVAAAVADASGHADFAPEPPSRYGNPDTYEVFGRTYRTAAVTEGWEEEGLASWYGDEFAGRRTSSGEIFDPDLLTAAHRTILLPAWVEVENLQNGRRVVVRVNDRGPFHDPERRIIDLSEAAARELGMIGAGVAPVRIRVLAVPVPAEERAGGGDPPASAG